MISTQSSLRYLYETLAEFNLLPVKQADNSSLGFVYATVTWEKFGSGTARSQIFFTVDKPDISFSPERPGVILHIDKTGPTLMSSLEPSDSFIVFPFVVKGEEILTKENTCLFHVFTEDVITEETLWYKERIRTLQDQPTCSWRAGLMVVGGALKYFSLCYFRQIYYEWHNEEE